MKRRKVKFAIEESDQEIRKIFSDQSMKVFRSNFEKRYVCLVEFRSGPAAFSFFPFSSDHPIDPLVPRSYLLRLLRFAYIRDSTKRGDLRVTGPRSKGGLPRVSPHDGQFVCRKEGRGPWKREVRPKHPSSHPIPTPPPLSFSSSSYVPNEAARWIDSPPRMRLFLPSPPSSSFLSFFSCPRIEQEHRPPPVHE